VNELEALGIPKTTVDSPPSPDLVPGIDDKFVLGTTYELLDQVSRGLEQARGRQATARELDIELFQIDHAGKRTRRSAHMHRLPPVPIWQQASAISLGGN
jgi:NAD+ synthase